MSIEELAQQYAKFRMVKEKEQKRLYKKCAELNLKENHTLLNGTWYLPRMVDMSLEAFLLSMEKVIHNREGEE